MTGLANKPVTQTIPTPQSGVPSNTSETNIIKSKPNRGAFEKNNTVLGNKVMEGTPVNKTKLGGS